MSRGHLGLTLLEILVSGAVLSAIALTILYASGPLAGVASSSAGANELDASAARILAELRREVRQSGFDRDGRPQVSSPADGATSRTLTLKVRTGLGETDWSDDITFATLDAGGARRRLTRSEGALLVEVARDIQDMTFHRPLESSLVVVTLTLTRTDPSWSETPRAFTRTYVEQIEMLNARP